MSTNVSADSLVQDLLDGGIVKLLELPDVRRACEEAAKELGCYPPTHKVAIWLLVQLIDFAQGLASEWSRNAFVKLVERVPGLRVLLEKLIAIEAACDEKRELRERLLLELRVIRSSAGTDVDHTTSYETLNFLWTRTAFENLDQQARDLLREISADLSYRFDGVYDPILSQKRLAAVAARAAAEAGGLVESLTYLAELDVLVGREDDLSILRSFLDSVAPAPERNRFRWQLLLGDAGDGKSRLALALMREAIAAGWHAGFLDRSEIVKLHPSRWRPRSRTLMIIDYAGEDAKAVQALLINVAQNAGQFDFPVRLLLLDRREHGTADEAWIPADSNRALVKLARFSPPHILGSLRNSALCAIVRRRLRGWARELSDEKIIDFLEMIDPRADDVNDDNKLRRPRPLYAVALAVFLNTVREPIGALSRDELFRGLLSRERQHFWGEPAADASPSAQNAFAAHLNLLALSTIFFGLSSEQLAAAPPGILPSESGGQPEFLPAVYKLMAGSSRSDYFGYLTPDLLGEYFVLERLAGLSVPAGGSKLLDYALEIGGIDLAIFARRAAVDFPDSLRRAQYLRPSRTASQAAVDAFCFAQVDMTLALGDHGNTDQAGELVSIAQALIPRASPLARQHIAMGLSNLVTARSFGGQAHLAKETLSFLKSFADAEGQNEIWARAASSSATVIRWIDVLEAETEFTWLLELARKRDQSDIWIWVGKAGSNLAASLNLRNMPIELSGHLERLAHIIHGRPNADLFPYLLEGVEAAVVHSMPELAHREPLRKLVVACIVSLEGSARLINADTSGPYARSLANLIMYSERCGIEAGAKLLARLKVLAATMATKEILHCAATGAYNYLTLCSENRRFQLARPEMKWLRQLAVDTEDSYIGLRAAEGTVNSLRSYCAAGFFDRGESDLAWLMTYAEQMNDREIWDRTALASLNMIAAYVNASKSIAAEPHLQFLKRLAETQPDSRIFEKALEASEALGALHERSGNLEAVRAERRWRRHILDMPRHRKHHSGAT